MAKAINKTKIVHSIPYYERTVVLNTTPAQLAFESAYRPCAKALQGLSSILPNMVSNKNELDAVYEAVENKLKEGLSEIREEANRIKKIAEDNGIELGKLKYTNSVSVNADLSSPRIDRYLQIIIELDELITLIHTAWFAGFIADDVKSALERRWRRKVISVAAEIKNISNRAFKAYTQKTKQNPSESDSKGTKESDTKEDIKEEEAEAKAA